MIDTSRSGERNRKGYMLIVKRYHMIAVLLVAVTQQIYFPQPLKYLHVAVLLVYVLFSDLYCEGKRLQVRDVSISLAVLAATLLSVYEHMVGQSYSLLYLGSVMVATICAGHLFYQLITVVLHPADWDVLKPSHRSTVQRAPKFVSFLFIGCQVAIGAALIDLIIQIIKHL